MIDREKVIGAVGSCFDDWLERHRWLHPLDLEKVRQLKADAIALLKEQDSCENCAIAIEDRQPVVRCKDCKWYKEGYDIDGKWFSRCNGSVRTYGHTKPDWFCADGERRNGDG